MIKGNKTKQTIIGTFPEDWNLNRLGAIGQSIIGLTYSPSQVVDVGILVLRSSNIKNGQLKYKDNVFVNCKIPKKLITQKNDILICVRNGSRNLIGKSALLNGRALNQTFGAFMSVFRSPENEWIQLLFKSSIILNQISRNIGATINQITNADLNSFIVPIPKKNEQDMIIAVITSIESQILSIQKLIDKKKKISQGVMQQLLSGKKRLPGYSKNWNNLVLGDVAEFYKGKGLPKKNIIEDGVICCIHYGELYTNYGEEINHINSRTNIDELALFSKKNDVLMPTSDVTPNGLAKASCIRVENVVLGGDILVIRPNGSIDGTFLSLIIRLDKNQIMHLVTGTTVYHLYASDMKKFMFNAPSIQEQLAIVDNITTMNREIHLLESKLEKINALKQGVMQQLLTGKIRLI